MLSDLSITRIPTQEDVTSSPRRNGGDLPSTEHALLSVEKVWIQTWCLGALAAEQMSDPCLWVLKEGSGWEPGPVLWDVMGKHPVKGQQNIRRVKALKYGFAHPHPGCAPPSLPRATKLEPQVLLCVLEVLIGWTQAWCVHKLRNDDM